MEAIRALLALLPVRFHVEFAVYCARDVIVNLTPETKGPSLAAIELTELWLKDPSKVSIAELNSAYNTAYNAAHNAAYSAVYSAVNSANSAYNAAYNAANSAYTAANSAANSAYTAANSANSANSAYNAAYSAANSEFNKIHAKKMKEYENHLKAMIKDMTKLQKEIYKVGSL